MFAMSTVAVRLRSLLDLVPGLTVRKFEKLARLRRGSVQKVMDGATTDPRSSTLLACAGVLGTTVEYLFAGNGAPSERRVRLAVAAANERELERLGGCHVASTVRRSGPRASRTSAQ